MKATTLPRLVAVLGAVALWTLMSPAPAAAIQCDAPSCPVVLDFTELANEGGITVTETGGPHGPASLGPVSGETVTIGPTPSPASPTPNFFPANCAVSDFSGLGTANSYVFNLLESVGGPISDQVIVTGTGGSGPDGGGNPVSVEFISDPDGFYLVGNVDRTTIEDGTRQLVGSYVNDKGSTVNIFVTSDVEAAVPAPATLLLLGAGLTGLAGVTWRRHRRA